MKRFSSRKAKIAIASTLAFVLSAGVVLGVWLGRISFTSNVLGVSGKNFLYKLNVVDPWVADGLTLFDGSTVPSGEIQTAHYVKWDGDVAEVPASVTYTVEAPVCYNSDGTDSGNTDLLGYMTVDAATEPTWIGLTMADFVAGQTMAFVDEAQNAINIVIDPSVTLDDALNGAYCEFNFVVTEL